MTSVVYSPTAFFFYQMLLGLYPASYRKAYGEEMRLLFEDLYKEEYDRYKEIGAGFWVRLVIDVLKSTLSEHTQLLRKIGLKKYLAEIYHINSYVSISFILLLPFLSVFILDALNVILTGHHEWLQVLYKSAFWNPYVVFTCAFIFPLLSIILSSIGLVRKYKEENHTVISLSFIARRFVSFLVIGLSVFAILVLLGHDLVPCVISQTVSNGLLHIFNALRYCFRNS